MKTKMIQKANETAGTDAISPEISTGNSFHIAGRIGSSPVSPTIPFQALSQPEGPKSTWVLGSNVPKPFWDRVHVGKPDECWLWKGSVDRDGYGRANLHGKAMSASRAAFIVANGYTPDGLLVCHNCNNPRCCNPAHLYAGTKSDNEKDKFKAGKTHKGRNNPAAILYAEQVEEIRRLIAEGHTNTKIAALYEVHHSTISKIRTGKSW